jgi:hypothetical protein
MVIGTLRKRGGVDGAQRGVAAATPGLKSPSLRALAVLRPAAPTAVLPHTPQIEHVVIHELRCACQVQHHERRAENAGERATAQRHRHYGSH